jgi:hypothetical protein
MLFFEFSSGLSILLAQSSKDPHDLEHTFGCLSGITFFPTHTAIILAAHAAISFPTPPSASHVYGGARSLSVFGLPLPARGLRFSASQPTPPPSSQIWFSSSQPTSTAVPDLSLSLGFRCRREV